MFEISNIFESIFAEVAKLSEGFFADPPSIYRNVFYRHNFIYVNGTIRTHWMAIMPCFVTTEYDEQALYEALDKFPNISFDSSSLWFTITCK